MGTICMACGEAFDRIGTHWRYNPDHRPSFSAEQREIVTGLLMGDGYIDTRRGNPYLVVNMITEEYLQYLHNTFENFSKGVVLDKTAEECAIYNGGDVENYNEIYSWRSCSHPELSEWSNWYSSGEKVWPDDIELTPTVLKHWYVGDGHLNKSSGGIELTVTNERGNRQKVQQYFSNAGLPVGGWWENTTGRTETRMYWNGGDRDKLFEYMGNPLPGFEYKWPKDLIGNGDNVGVGD